jgi:predicted N-acetyltransferase YhbS
MTELPRQYQLRPADRETDLMAISRMVSNAFAGGVEVEEISQMYIGSCHYDFPVSQLIWVDDTLAHHWGVWGYPMRVGAAQLRAAGIGAVVTLEAHRKQGLMAAAAEASFTAMREAGYDISILRGRHYHKFGYRRAWNYVTTKLNPQHTPPETIPVFPLKSPYRALGPDDMAQINDRYNQEYREVTGSCVRPTYDMLAAGDMGAYGWFEGDRLAGYVRAVPTEDKSALQCLEAAGDPEQGLAVLADRMTETGCQQLHFFTMPARHPILQIVRRGACTVEDRYFHHTGWQIKLINLHSALVKLVPLFEDRLAASHLAGWRGKLHLDAGDQAASLEIEKGTVSVTTDPPGKHVITAGPALGRLLIGSEDPDEIIRQEDIRLSGDAGELAGVLFPNRHPMMSHWDEF